MPITAIFAGANALILLILAVMIVPRRRAAGISLGFGEDEMLKRAVRAHGNAVEYMPMAILLIASLEALAAPAWLLWALGGLFTLARLLHPIAIYRKVGVHPFRTFGTAASWFVFAVGGVACLVFGASALGGT